MSEIVERVAKVLFAFQAGGSGDLGETTEIAWHHLNERARNLWFDMARGAIEAMREPTWEMITNARRVQLLKSDEYESEKGYFAQAYKYMIDAALK